MISYRDNDNFDLKVARCTNSACLGKIVNTVDRAGSVGTFSSIGSARMGYLLSAIST